MLIAPTASELSTCSDCGCIKLHVHSTTGATEALVESLSPSEDITATNEEVSRIDEEVSLMLIKRASVLQRVNSIQSPIYSIPPKVLSHILKMAAIVDVSEMSKMKIAEWPMPYIPLVLGAVSSYWRNVVHSTPRIWTSIRMERAYWSPTYRDKKIALLRYYLERARTLPLSVGFAMSNNSDKSQQNLNSVMNVLFQDNPTRIRALYLRNILIQTSAMSKIYPQLEVLSISYGLFMEFNFTLPSLPSLRHLSLKRTPTIQFSTTSITCLHLTRMMYDQCIELLLLCRTTLVEFRSRKTRPALDHDWAERNIIHTLPHVKTFEWEFTTPYVDYDPFILAYLNMPQLHNLNLLNVTRFQRIDARSSPQTSAVNIYLYIGHDNPAWGDGYDECQENGLVDLISTLDAQRLVVGHAGWYKIKRIIHWLNPSYTEGRKCIPSLKVLSLPMDEELSSDFKTRPETWLRPLVLMLEKRLRVGKNSDSTNNEPFILELPCNEDKSKLKWGKYERRIQALVDAGLLQVDACDNFVDPRSILFKRLQ